MKLPRMSTVHGMFEQQVRTTPDRIALIYQNSKVTFRDLNQRANAIALGLRARAIEDSSIVALISDRSIDMIAAILAILKSGAAYLPIDPALPVSRIEYMLSNSNASLLLANCSDKQKIELLSTKTPTANTALDFPTAHDENPVNLNTNDDLLYVIYTSGSTGMPKGVMLHHGALINLVKYQHECTNIDFTRVMQFAPISFDVASQEIFSTLIAGGTLCLADENIRRNARQLFGFIERHHIKTLFVPAAFLNLVSTTHAHLFPKCLSHIVSAGEQLIVSPQLRAYLKNNSTYLHNHYGPSETHVVTSLTLDPSQDIPTRPSIGRPLSNITIYIMNEKGQVLDEDELGELYIGGAQVGKGYINNPQLTEERFIPDPLIAKRRIYRTGDIARWLPDGNIEFIGRADNQIKISGYRIQLEEIESRLSEHAEIEAAAVTVYQRSIASKCLCAYYAAPAEIESKALKEFLSQTLPDYMLPSYYARLNSLPLTINGKVDKTKLPGPDFVTTVHSENHADPVRMKLISIFAEVLGTAQVGLHDRFAEMELDSLDIMLLNLLMNDSFSLEISLDDMTHYPSIDNLAHFIWQQSAVGQAHPDANEIPNNHEPKTASVNLIPNQNEFAYSGELPSYETKEQFNESVERQMNGMASQIIQSSPVHIFPAPALQQYYLESDLINQHIVPELIEVSGSNGYARLKHDLQQLVQNHVILRTSLRRGKGPLNHFFVEHTCPKNIQIPFVDLSNRNTAKQMEIITYIIKSANQRFDLFDGLFYRLVGVRARADHVFLLCFSSHFMVDGLTSFERVYSSLDEIARVQRTNSYLGYETERQNEFAELSNEQKEMYLRHFREHWSVVANFRTRFLNDRAGETRTIVFELPYGAKAFSLKEFCVTVVCRTLAKVLEEETLPIRLFFHGRDYGKQQFYDLMGDLHDHYFLNVVASANDEPIQTLVSIKEQLLKIGYGKTNMNNVLVRLVRQNMEFLSRLSDQSSAITINIDPVSSQMTCQQDDTTSLSYRIRSAMKEYKKSSVRGISVRICPDVQRKRITASLKHVDYLQHRMNDVKAIMEEEATRLLNSLSNQVM